MELDQSATIIQWALVIGSSIMLLWVSPIAHTVGDFFRGSKHDASPNVMVLTSSLVISWIFAKSITNAANLGLSYGIVGGVAYAAYYLSFLIAGITLYSMRVKGGVQSIHHFLKSKFGTSAIVLFSFLIAFRLLNEVWSNTMVIGSYFGEVDSTSYYASIVIFTLLTLGYTLKGGLRSSLLTDLIQMGLFAVLLVVILGVILPKSEASIGDYLSTGEWSSAGGINLLFVALLQVLSYPYHDPVMTDRAFIAEPLVTLKSFILATIIGSLSIILFSFVGIFGQMEGLSGQAPVEVSKLLGVGMMILVNFIMITSAASTLDSAFNSFSKMMVVDIKIVKEVSISKGRLLIVLGCIAGTLPLLLNPSILSATTISGTMVIGLTPVFLFWSLGAPKVSFHLSVITGIVVGTLHVFDFKFNYFQFSGPYADLLAANIVGVLACTLLYLIPIGINHIRNK